MTEIEGNALMTLTANAGETYCVQYNSNYIVDILNETDGEIYISSDGDFNETGDTANYLTIPAGNGYNNYNHIYAFENKLYIKADTSGKICITARR